MNGAASNVLTITADAAGPAGGTGILNGTGGTVRMEGVLVGNDSLVDRLVLDGGGAIGVNTLSMTNLGGGGALTTGDGILLVDAINGATTEQGAFVLPGMVMAGPFEYRLFRSGAGGIDNWYLRSADTRSPNPDPDPTPLIRPEIPAYVLAAELAYRMGIVEVGTFNERRGNLAMLNANGEHRISPIWQRAYGETSSFGSGAVLEGNGFDLEPRFEGAIMGYQIGSDLWGHQDENGSEHRAGLFYSMVTGFGHTYGNISGEQDARGSALSLNSHGLGGYYTYTDAAGFYLDAVGTVSTLSGGVYSGTGVQAAIDGTAWTASIEVGQDMVLAEGTTLQPQAQLIWRQTNLHSVADPVSNVDIVDIGEFTARLGLRLENSHSWDDNDLTTHVGVNLWHTVEHANSVKVGDWHLHGRNGGTSLEVNAGATAKVNDTTRIFGNASYTQSLDHYSEPSVAFQGGFKVAF
nr:autotransporter outer membrane beta-barrel domain-containing protein [Devosia sp. MC532]